MKKYTLLFCLLWLHQLHYAQIAPYPIYELPPTDTTTIFIVAEEMPRFYCADCEALETINEKKKCADKNMLEFVYGNIKYPNTCQEDSVIGTIVVLTFVIDELGQMQDIKIIRGIHPSLDGAALRVIKKMSEHQWVPGRMSGKVIKMRYNLPIRFKLQ